MSDERGFDFKPGRHGRTDIVAGVRVREYHSHWLASLLVRPGCDARLAAIVAQTFAVDLPTTPRVVAARRLDGQIHFLWCGPGQWLIESSARDIDVDGLQAIVAEVAAVFDQSDSRVLLDVSGSRVRDALAKGLPIDLDPVSFRTGDVAVTAASHIGVQIWQLSDEPVYRLAVARSYFASFWRWLAASAAEYGCDVVASK